MRDFTVFFESNGYFLLGLQMAIDLTKPAIKAAWEAMARFQLTPAVGQTTQKAPCNLSVMLEAEAEE